VLDWLHRFLHGLEGLIPQPVRDAIGWTASAIGGILGTLSGNVSDAWHDLDGTIAAISESTRILSLALSGKFDEIIKHWIPHYAYQAWWYATHPDALASILLWHIIKYLEKYAWTAARYLGQFALALVLHNARRLAALIEEILTAVL
jgi:hypothetical protein